MGFSKKVTRQYLLYLLKQVQQQAKVMASHCPSTRPMDILTKIQGNIEQLKESLTDDEKTILSPPEN